MSFLDMPNDKNKKYETELVWRTKDFNLILTKNNVNSIFRNSE